MCSHWKPRCGDSHCTVTNIPSNPFVYLRHHHHHCRCCPRHPHCHRQTSSHLCEYSNQYACCASGERSLGRKNRFGKTILWKTCGVIALEKRSTPLFSKAPFEYSPPTRCSLTNSLQTSSLQVYMARDTNRQTERQTGEQTEILGLNLESMGPSLPVFENQTYVIQEGENQNFLSISLRLWKLLISTE